ncbi:hypothetical protein HPP92_008647 [Vanilla planifolia]|uniref:Uncharacterized protein n=1 Tax=Vanilla planifolia TaxID=51239 RepID=A0A835V4P3_VANPL|nr:hypothetical protein HPP92_008647 [Vanilla planifolia]
MTLTLRTYRRKPHFFIDAPIPFFFLDPSAPYCKDFLRSSSAPPVTSSHCTSAYSPRTPRNPSFISGNPASVRIKDEHLRLAIVNIPASTRNPPKRLVPCPHQRAHPPSPAQGHMAGTHTPPRISLPDTILHYLLIDRNLQPREALPPRVVNRTKNIFIPGRVKRSRKLPKETTTRGFRRMEPTTWRR